MKIKKLICKECGYEDRIEIFTREEAERNHIQVGQPRCSKCGSTNVILHD